MNGTGTNLVDLVFERVAADDQLPARVGELVLAACEGEGALDKALEKPDQAPEPEPRIPQDPGAGIFLSGISVQGFRGIGQQVGLPLAPGPGLTVVTGRNGSGKSSFAEGAELALTGKNARWGEPLSAVWREGWRNLHTSGDVSIVAVTLVRGGQTGAMTAARTWQPDDELVGGTWTEQQAGQKVAPFDQSRWRDPLETYRPFLPYSELGKLVGGRPIDLYNAVHRLLGLAVIADAQTLLSSHRLKLAKKAKHVRDRKREIAEQLGTSEDERAQQAKELLSKQKPDMDAVAELAIGTDVGATDIALLRALSELTPPAAGDVEQCRELLAEALKAVTEAASGAAQMALNGSKLVRVALDLHRATGDGPCPVCEVGRLDATWQARTTERLGEMEKIATALANAGNQLDTANAAAWELCEPTPTVLVRTTDLVDTTAARTAWNAWHSCISLDDPTELRDALLTRHSALVEALDALRTSAQEQATTMDHVWRPLAAVLLEWHRAAAEVLADTQLLVDITAAENWIKQAAAQLRVERMAPFAEQSQEIWRKLRQQSNVDLGAISLEGTANTNKRVELNVSVDGVENAALAVMSQGELHALGLALFLPRATVDESPFRFLVIDDPVQAMDPSKVDGLAQVLADAALTRQVVVFTHDERLAEAVRRLRLPATVWEVCRRERSVVEVRRSDSPVSRYLADARALLNTDELPGELRSELVISFCRNAVEAASHTKVRELRLGRGVPHTEVEQALDVAHTTHQKATLAVFDDPARSGDLLHRLRSALGPWAPTALQTYKQGAHVGYTGDLAGLVDDTKRLADWLQR